MFAACGWCSMDEMESNRYTSPVRCGWIRRRGIGYYWFVFVVSWILLEIRIGAFSICTCIGVAQAVVDSSPERWASIGKDLRGSVGWMLFNGSWTTTCIKARGGRGCPYRESCPKWRVNSGLAQRVIGLRNNSGPERHHLKTLRCLYLLLPVATQIII
jgi:hypothetical protein